MNLQRVSFSPKRRTTVSKPTVFALSCSLVKHNVQFALQEPSFSVRFSFLKRYEGETRLLHLLEVLLSGP